jgi:hypothetical protein
LLRGWGIRAVAVLLALAACLSLAESATAGKKTERILAWNVQARASNGYDLDLEAFRTTDGGASAMLTFSNGSSAAQYIVRRPAHVTKRRLTADFGAIGSVDLRRKARFRDRSEGDRCERFALGYGRLKGGLRIEGEDGFARVRDAQVSGSVFRFTYRKRCKGEGDRFPIFRPDYVDRSRVLISCGAQSGAGLMAAKFEPGREVDFTAFRRQQAGDVQIIRVVSLNGATRRFDVAPGARAAKLRPPAPFEGRADYEDGEMRGNLRVPLPGGGLVRLTPGDATLGALSEVKRLPKCFPPLFIYGTSSSETVSVVAREVQEALTRGTRRALAALAGR